MQPVIPDKPLVVNNIPNEGSHWFKPVLSVMYAKRLSSKKVRKLVKIFLYCSVLGKLIIWLSLACKM